MVNECFNLKYKIRWMLKRGKAEQNLQKNEQQERKNDFFEDVTKNTQ